MDNKIEYLVKLKGMDLSQPSPVIKVVSQGDVSIIKQQIRIKLQIILPKEVKLNAHTLPIYYRVEKDWKPLKDQESLKDFIDSKSRYMMVDVNRIKQEYQRLEKNFNNFQSQVQLHSVRVRSFSGEDQMAQTMQQPQQMQQIQQIQNTVPDIPTRPMTARNPKIRIIQAFIYEVKDEIKDEMKKKIEQEGEEFQQKIQNGLSEVLKEFRKLCNFEDAKIVKLDAQLKIFGEQKQKLEQKLKDIKEQQKCKSELIRQKISLTNVIDNLQKELDNMQNNIIKLQKQKNAIGEKLINKLKEALENKGGAKKGFHKQNTLPENMTNSSSGRSVGRQPLNIQKKIIQLNNYPKVYEIGL